MCEFDKHREKSLAPLPPSLGVCNLPSADLFYTACNLPWLPSPSDPSPHPLPCLPPISNPSYSLIPLPHPPPSLQPCLYSARYCSPFSRSTSRSKSPMMTGVSCLGSTRCRDDHNGDDKWWG